MEILRVEGADLSILVPVEEESTSYSYTVKDFSDMSVSSGSANSGAESSIHVHFPEEYDSTYEVELDGYVDEITVVRPYTPILGTTATEIEEYKRNERLARAIIDSIVPEGFYYSKKVIETTGNGADYLPIWCNAKKLLSLYENNVLIFDEENPDNYEFTYDLSDDKTSITQVVDYRVNKLEGAALVMPAGGSDLLDVKYSYRGFPKTFDYKIVVENGYRSVPSDIQDAAALLIEDIACGRMEYFKRYITDYKTDQFNIKLDGQAFEGTGNLIVDKILSKYSKSITSIGVL